VLKNGLICTVDRDHTIATALVVRGDSIIYVGDVPGARRLAGSQTRDIDLQGKLVLPSFF
jgi:predicted amidohydrolase YtcJ